MALVFVDVETTGLDPARHEVWEFAAIRREDDGSETRHHCFVQHSAWRVESLPEAYRADHDTRYDGKVALTPTAFGDLLDHVMRDKPRLIGAAPWFDASHLALYCGGPLWSHRLIDVETLAAGRAGRLMNGLAEAAAWFEIKNPAEHTAMADAETAMRVFDAAMTS